MGIPRTAEVKQHIWWISHAEFELAVHILFCKISWHCFSSSVKCWVSFCGLWFHLMTSARGWSQFCRSWTLASASFFRKSKRTTVNIMQFVFTHYPNKDMRSGSDSPCGFFLRQLPAKLLQTYMTFIFLLCRPNQNKSLKTLTEVLLQLLNATFGICNMSHISQQHITSIM